MSRAAMPSEKPSSWKEVVSQAMAWKGMLPAMPCSHVGALAMAGLQLELTADGHVLQLTCRQKCLLPGMSCGQAGTACPSLF